MISKKPVSQELYAMFLLKGTWAGIDPILKWLDDTKPIPTIPVCRFSQQVGAKFLK